MKEIYIAPVQGHTDAAWRHFHHEIYGGTNKYFTPFIRCEHGTLRKQDIRELTSELNSDIDLEPQVIFRDMAELDVLLKHISEQSTYTRVNLNMGCPFPLQTGKGRGAGFLGNTEEIAKLSSTLAKYSSLTYSAKMRLGYSDSEEWRGVMSVLNELELRHIDIHPRVAKQQYSGDLYMNQFEAMLQESRNPIVFNGEIRTPSDITSIETKYPQIVGVMTARGVLGRPSLAAEYQSGEEWAHDKRIEKMLEFHRALLSHYEEILCGESQILSKIKPFWEYAEEEIGRKAWKAIKKATNMAKYHSAVAQVE